MNKYVLTQTSKQLEKIVSQHIELARDEKLFKFEDGLLQTRKLRVEFNKRIRKLEEKKEETAVKQQQYNIITKIVS